MTEEFVYDWVVAGPIEAVAAQVEAVCATQGLGGTWYSSAPGGVAVKGCRLSADGAATLAVLTLQARAEATTHLRLQAAARADDPARVAALAEALQAALGATE